MNSSRKTFLACLSFLFVATTSLIAQSDSKTYTYESVPNDPLNARIYKLDNGLTVYMSVYKNAPRIQTYIATRAGSKNDPKDATGLAHYLEHMLFKGTDKYGSKDYAKEKVELDKIEALYEVYRKTKDEGKRKSIYHQIDSISGYASTFAIANEYDKMMSSIGAKGTNAYTWLEQTVYVNDIPTNQLEKWCTIEAERYRNPVLRLFHTELEAVYEEKNRGLDSDGDKAWEALFSGLFPTNTYGSQTTIGTIEHLKNPSLTEIKKYFNTYYVPNNMAICLSGDLDPDATIKLIDEKFNGWKSKPVPAYEPFIEPAISKHVTKNVTGPDAENLMMGFRFPGTNTKDADMLMLISKILSNGNAGLIDLNINQQQKALEAGAFDMEFKDYSALILSGTPKEGQTLEQLQSLLLEQISNLKNGNFPDWLLSAVITDMKLQQTKMYERNGARADAFVNAFISGTPWKDAVNTIDRLSKISKQDLINFTKSNLNDNYVIVYKHTGEDKNVQKVIKPEITPVSVNRNDQSEFVKNILNTPIKEIEPVFLDYNKDIRKLTAKNNIPVLYTENTENKTFALYYNFEMGSKNDKKLGLAIDYLKYLGTDKLSAAEVQQEFYKLGGGFGVFSGEDETWVTLGGLSENFEKATKLFEDLLANAQPNDLALKNLISDQFKKREDAKLNKNEILYNALSSYGKYGKFSPYTNILSNTELQHLTPQELITITKKITSYEHDILYYGSNSADEVVSVLNKHMNVPEKLMPIPAPTEFKRMEMGPSVYVVDYDMKQAEIIMLSKGENYNKANIPKIRMFNEYFGGSMSSIVFQEMRESKALAYSVYSSYLTADKKSEPNYVFSYIGTQADKLPEAMSGMMELINNMPDSKNNFLASQEAIIQGIRTERITKEKILFNYEDAKKLGLDYDIRKDIFSAVPKMTFNDVKAFEEEHMKGKPYTILVLGKKDGLDIKTLEKYGKVSFLSLEDVFGY
ncbi:MAG: peptidase domain protein [Bacteroidota bacterium]|jgi:predicted Zn-dependent peptidase|nr:peptidase domain protein [Bacteroidota bacterium]